MDVITSLHNPLNCLRCNSAMQNPIRLPCQHHFCRDCVGSTECISCLKPFNVDELVIDKVLNYIVESSREPTETCANCDKISQPMFFCETCQQPLCGECRENTHRAKIFLLHNIVQMEERGRIRNRPFCSTHNEPYILYCLDAKSLMCIECFNSSSLERRGHFLNIDVAHKICCDKLEKSAFNLKTFQSELREQCDLRRRLIDELEKNFDFMSKEVNNKCDDIIVRINQLRSLLLDKLLKEKSGKMDKIISQLKNFDQLESPLAINLLSVSIFCSYASKIDLLHCYGDLSKLIQQFLSSNGQLLQKVKFDSTLNIDFAKEFNLMICQPMGFITSLNENCLMPNKLIVNSGNSKIKNDERVSSSEVKLPNAFDFGFGSDVLISSELASVESTNFNIFPVHSESDTFIEQRFLDLFQNIAIPLQKFTKEISFISSNLIDLHKDIVLRRCVVNGEGLINRLLCCENAWDQLEAHKNKVQMIIQQSLSQLWRQDLERVQRQQQLVREKLEEMQHLQKLAKQALKFSQHFKPFAVQMAGIISVIDVRRTTLAVLSPMEQICSEISNIGPDSESRVAAINKEEKSRLEKIANTLANQAIDYDAMQALKSLKVIPSTSKHPPHRKNPIFEVDRNRPDTSDFCKDSILNSPSVIKKRHQILNRVQRESKVSSNLKIEVENSNNQDATTSEKNPNDARTVEVDQVLNKETIISSDAREDEVKNENSEEFASKIDDSSLLDSSKNKPNITFGLQNRDPAVLIARETLLNSIKEKVKRID